MSMLSTITTGPSRSGVRVILAGQEKMGKTTLGAGAPGVLLIPCEVGFAGVGCAKTAMLQSLEELWALNEEIEGYARAGQFPFKTLFFDSATAIERFIHTYVLQSDPLFNPKNAKKSVTMDSAHGGYGKAYNLSNDYFAGLMAVWDRLAVNHGINIVLTCHVFSSKIQDPTVGEYDVWDLLLHSPKNNKTYGKREMITQWADMIGFLYEPLFISQANEKAMAKASSQGKGRVIGLSRTPSYVAGNRFGIMGEVPLPGPPANGWNNIAQALYQASGVDVFTR